MTVLTLIVVLATAGSEPILTAESSAATVTLGDSVTVRIAVTHPASANVTMPASLPFGDAFAELARSSERLENGDDTVTSSFALELGAYELGELEIPSIPLLYARGSESRSLRTATIPLEVLSVVGQDDSGALRPAAEPVQVVRRDFTWVYVVAGVLGTLGLVVSGFMLWNRRELNPTTTVRAATSPIPELSPHDEAMARFDELEACGALGADELEPAYTRMSEIVRGYLGRRFEFPALDSTTAEIDAELASNAAVTAVASELSAWLADCDFVKFAEYPASPSEARQALRLARQIVTDTRESVPTAPGKRLQSPRLIRRASTGGAKGALDKETLADTSSRSSEESSHAS